ncbi:hypothetical protein FHT87_005130 [Rhizobium sp. BK316]|uniref:hypothetical protein n=1 Tax=Rhizobium sp. BK316 TaxID=2587053 RepID=UPI00161D69A0|nr:hypothetical protein [Rhizobium sp. BK316]MBB3411177.1 hypothetical protein [Rhizobium sp. BK316]
MTDIALTKEQMRDLRAIHGNPGCYSRCKEDGELMTLANLSLIRWIETGGYEITRNGIAALNEPKKARLERVEAALRDNIQAALPKGVIVDYRYAALAAIAAAESFEKELAQ